MRQIGSPQPITCDEITAEGAIVVLAPHPDDESLGCGGLLASLFASTSTKKSTGRPAHVVCMTDGRGSHPGSQIWFGAKLADQRQTELKHAVKCLGGEPSDLTFLGHPDGWLGAEDADAIAADICELCERVNARALFSPSPVDNHEDHKSTARIALLVAARLSALALWYYPVWSRWDRSDFIQAHAPAEPRLYDTTRWQAAKRQAIGCHRSQLGQVVTDDPSGFAMEQAFVDRFTTEPEIYFEVRK